MTILNQTYDNGITLGKVKELLEQERTFPCTVGQKWYIINQKWWLEFVQQVESDNNDESRLIRMPPITNNTITEKKTFGDQTWYDLKDDLKVQIDIAVLPEPVFIELKNAYDVGDEKRDVIAREVVKGNLLAQNDFIEIYKLKIKFADYDSKEQVYTKEFSHADSVEYIRDQIMKHFNIGEQDRDSTRFFVEDDNGHFELLPETISQVKMSALLNSGTIIYVDSSGMAMDISQQKQGATYNGAATRAGTRYSAYSRVGANFQRGVCGLQNLGNTCFMNSALQCLSNVPDLTRYFLNNDYASEVNEHNTLGTQGRLVKAYAELLQEMWSGQLNSVRPGRFKSVIGEFAPRFNGYAQQDSQELTAFLLDGLHEDLNRIKNKPYIEEKEVANRNEAQAAAEAWQDYKKRNDSIIVDLLHGQLKSTLTCNICSKVSIKFDPFCFLSVPIPTKERQTKSTITFVRKSKWAKFSITHTNKTTAGQVKKVLREQLGLPEEAQIILSSYYSSDILDDPQPIAGSTYPGSKSYYAYAVDGPGPILMVENRSTVSSSYNSGALLALAFPVNCPKKLTRRFVYEEVLPRCREYFWQEKAGTSTIEDKLKADDATMVVDGVDSDEQLMPDKICYGNQEFPEEPDKEVPIADIVKHGNQQPRIVLRWNNSKRFYVTNIDNLVEREVNMTTPMKKAYSLKECIDLYTTCEQLSEEDSWYCPECKTHQRAYKKLDLWSLPKILIIHLKRFIYSRYTRDKIDTEIEIPVLGFDLKDKVLDPAHQQEKYDLIGISLHSGGLGGGHYTARALNGNGWYEFNDSSAFAISSPGNGDSLISREAYMLVYRRREQP